MIKKEGNKFFVFNKEGNKKLSKGYPTESEAKKRLAEIEAFADDENVLRAGEKFEDVEYKGKSVTLNKPFRTPNEKKKFAVYAKNSKGDVVIVRFGDPNMEIKRDDPQARKNYRARHKCDMQKDRSTPAYWSCKMWSGENVKDITDCAFNLKAIYDATTKKLTSVRDGVQEYLGVELGIEPASKVFTVYRSPETISAIVGCMDGLPIINEHMDVDKVPTDKQTIGKIADTEVFEYTDGDTDSTLVLRNKANVGAEMLRLADSGKREFSLGYKAKVREHEKYDFEQYDIVPKHLALVDSARGGRNLTFQDGKDMKKIFLDDDGKFSIDKALQFMDAAAESVKDASEEDKAKMSEKAKAMIPEKKEDAKDQKPPFEKKEGEKKEGDDKKEDAKDEKKYSDADFKDAVSKLAASQAQDEIKEWTYAAGKAKSFLPENYAFADKSAKEIMRDTLKQEKGEEFKDSELSVAFRMLEKNNKYENFGDSKKDDFDWDKEL